MDEQYQQVNLDTREMHLELHKKLNAEIEKFEGKKKDKKLLAALDGIAFALADADLPFQAEVKSTVSLYGYLYINVYGLDNFSDIAEVLSALNNVVPSYWQDPEPSFDSTEKSKTWHFYLGTKFDPLSGVFLKAFVDPESNTCKVITETIEYTVPAEIKMEQRTKVLCPGDPEYYEH